MRATTQLGVALGSACSLGHLAATGVFGVCGEHLPGHGSMPDMGLMTLSPVLCGAGVALAGGRLADHQPAISTPPFVSKDFPLSRALCP